MKKLSSKKISVITKLAPIATIVACSFSSLYCSGNLFEAIKKLLSNILGGLLGLVTLVALIMIIWNGIVLMANSGDQKIVAEKKSAIKTIFVIYGVIVFSSLIIGGIVSVAKEALGSGSILVPDTNVDVGGLQ